MQASAAAGAPFPRYEPLSPPPPPAAADAAYPNGVRGRLERQRHGELFSKLTFVLDPYEVGQVVPVNIGSMLLMGHRQTLTSVCNPLIDQTSPRCIFSTTSITSERCFSVRRTGRRLSSVSTSLVAFT